MGDETRLEALEWLVIELCARYCLSTPDPADEVGQFIAAREDLQADLLSASKQFDNADAMVSALEISGAAEALVDQLKAKVGESLR